MTTLRKTPALSNNGGLKVNDSDYAEEVNANVVALWARVACWLTSVGGTPNAITASADALLTASPVRPMSFWLVPISDNTSGTTIDIDSVGAIDVVDIGGVALSAGALTANNLYLLVFDGTSYRVVSGGGSSAQINTAPDLILHDEKTLGTNGGSISSGSWVTRTLNTVSRNVLSGASLASNQFTLQPGTYFINAKAPGRNVAHFQIRIFDVTASSAVEYSRTHFESSGNVNEYGEVSTVITLTTAHTFRIEMRTQNSQSTDGLGSAGNIGTRECYSIVHVWQVGSLPTQVNGIPGGALSFFQTFSSTTTDGDPGNGIFRLDNATQNSATNAYVDLLDFALTDVTALLDTFDSSPAIVKGSLKFVRADDPTRWLVFNLLSRTTATGYRKFSLVIADSSAASPFVNGDKVLLTYTPVGPFVQWYAGSVDPSAGTGKDGDFYIQVGTGATGVTGDLWEKSSGAWSDVGNIRGPAGNATGPASAVDSDFVLFDGTSGGLFKDTGLSLDTDGTLATDSDVKIPSQKAVKTYIDAHAGSIGIVLLGKQDTAGLDTCLWVDSANRLWGCGRSSSWITGDPDNDTYTPITIPFVDSSGNPLTPATITKVVCDAESAFVLDANGVVYSFGVNTYGELGHNDTTSRHSATRIQYFITNSLTISDVFVARSGRNSMASTTFFITSTGDLYGCGRNSNGNLGDTTTTQRNQPVGPLLTNVVKVSHSSSSNGGGSALALRSDGSLYGTGGNTQGELGLNNTTEQHSWQQIFASGVADCSMQWTYDSTNGHGWSMIRKTDNTIWACGYNAAGQLGQGNTTDLHVFTQIGTATNWTKIATVDGTGGFAMALNSLGEVWTWGKNSNGQVGNGNTTDRTTPFKPTSGPMSSLQGTFTDIWCMGTGNAATSFALCPSGLVAAGYSNNWNTATGSSNASNSTFAYVRGLPDVGSKFQDWSTQGNDSNTFLSILYNDGNVYGSGSNTYGQLARGNTNHVRQFVRLTRFA